MNPDSEYILKICLAVLILIVAGFVFGYMAGMFHHIDPADFADSAITIICMGCGK